MRRTKILQVLKKQCFRRWNAPASRQTARCYTKQASNIVRSPLQVEIPNVTLHEYVFDGAMKYPDRVASECGITGRKYSFEELRRYSSRIASSFQTRFKLSPLDSVAIVLPNIPEFPAIFLGASEAGLITTTVNPWYNAEEISRQLTGAKVKIVFTTADKYKVVVEAVRLCGEDIPIVVVRTQPEDCVPSGAVNFEELTDPALPTVRTVTIDNKQTLVLPYSSGTTGLNKGVQLSHYNIVANLCQLLHPQVRLSEPATKQSQESIIGLLPLFHIFGMTLIMLRTLGSGHKLVTLPGFEPKTYLETLVKTKARVLYLVPPIVLYLGSNQVQAEKLSSVDVVLTGGAPCGEKDAERLQRKLKKGAHIIQGYGLTETSPSVFNPVRSRYHKLASVGVPVANTNIRVVDVETGNDKSVNEVGEIYVSGPQVMKGYLNNEKANKETFVDEWLRTGDLGYYDQDGDFFIVDRLKELIKVKGFQVPPAELEELLRSHPKIADAAVIGIPDMKSGEVPRAYVVAKPDQAIDEKEIQDFVATHVVEYKQLQGGVEMLDNIPKSPSGKILRKVLREMYQQRT